MIIATGTSYGQAERKNYLYQWTDERGGVHITDGLGKVPEQFRGKAVILEQRGDEQSAQDAPRRTEAPADTGPQEVGIELDKSAVWQQRLKNARQRLADSTLRFEDLDRKRKSLLVRDAPPANVAEALRIETEMDELKKQIEQIRNEIDVVIPDGARRDGVPPGMLRD